MSGGGEWIEANERALKRVPKLGVLFIVLLVLGALGFYLGFDDGLRALQAYWVNFLFFAGLAQGGVIVSTLQRVGKGTWGGPVVRLGLMNVAFLPVTLVLFIGVIVMAPHVLPWVLDPGKAAGKEWWLNLPFFIIRNVVALIILTAVSLMFAYRTVRPEAGAIKEATGKDLYPAWLTRNWKGTEAEREKSNRILSVLTPWMLLTFAVVYSLIGFDLVMSLEARWFSTLFGMYYFITTIYTGIAATAILASLLRTPLGLVSEMTSKRFHDIGKLLFAFTILSTDFLWSQFLVIWYGDLPEENFFVLQRIGEQPWQLLSWMILFCGFVIPFIALLPQITKKVPSILSVIAFIVLLGVFFERAVMVLRSLYPETGATFPIGVVEVLVFLGFLGIYGAAYLWSMRRLPLVPENTYAEAGHH